MPHSYNGSASDHHHIMDSQSESSVDKAVVTQKSEMGSDAHEENAGHRGPASMPPVVESSETLWWSRIREDLRDGFSEFFGVMILVLFGDGVVAQVILSGETKGNYQSISWGWGLGVMLGVYVGGKSGGHLNPAVTLANCIFRKHPWRKFPIYFIGQFLGGMAGAFIVYGNYRFAIDQFEGGSGIRTVVGETATAGVFCTYPADFMNTTAMVWSEFIASAILMFVIYALTDNDSIGAGPLFPLCLFFLIFGIGACFGWQTGYAINLARDTGPRLVSHIVGYGSEVWTVSNYYSLVPIFIPFIGCVFGGFLYDVFIYTGESPINTPYMGFQRLIQPRRSVWSNTYKSPLDSRV